MQQLRLRPFALFCLSFIVGVSAAELAMLCGTAFLPYAAVCGFCALLFFLFSLIRRFRKTCLCLACCAVCVAVGLFCHYFSAAKKEALLLSGGNCPVTVECTVTERFSATVYGVSYRCRVSSVNGTPCRSEIVLLSEGSAFFPIGERIRFSAALTAPEEETSGGFPERRYRRSLGILASAVLKNDSAVECLGEDSFLSLLAIRFRKALIARVDQGAAYRDGGLCAALLAGDRSGIAASAKLDLRRAGITHLLAISGMHLSMLVGGAHLLLRRLRVRKGVRYFLLSLLAALYCVAAGFSPSVLRAAFMLLFVFLAYFCGRERDAFTALAGSVACILAVSPTAASGCALWLSAFSTFGILIAVSLSRRLCSWVSARCAALQLLFDGILLPLGISIAATLAALPITWLLFRQVSLAAPIATLLCSPLTALLLFFSGVFALVGFPLPLFTPAAEVTARLLLWTVKRISSLRGVLLSLSYSFVPYLLAAGFLLLAAVLLLKKRARSVCAVLLLCTLLGFPTGILFCRSGEKVRLDAVFTCYSRSDLLAAGCDDGCGMILFDLSNGYSRAVRAAEDAAEQLCKTEVELLVITRLDNAAVRMIRSLGETLRVRQVLLPSPGSEKEEAVLHSAEAAAEQVGAARTLFSPDTAFTAGGVTCTVFPSEYASHSVVPIRAFSMNKGEASLLFVSSGSASSPAYARLKEVAAECDLLILGASGPKDVIEPEYAVDSVRTAADAVDGGIRIVIPAS